MINVMIMSAGRRVELVQRFKRAAKKLGIDSTIVAVDITNKAPALYFADKFYMIPRISSDDYIDAIIDVCNKEDIRLIVPTIDTELPKLAKYREYIESKTNAKVLISSEEVVNICNDKENSQKFFEENGFGVPKELNKDDILQKRYSVPLFIKPADGSSSVNTFKINSEEELDFFLGYVDNPIIQDFMSGTEYSIDAFCDFDGNPVTVVPRIRIAVRNGEILKGRIDKDREVIEDVLRVLKVLKPIGQVTVQCMKTEQGIKYIEINPRFGGGSPMSIDAGADSCANLFRLLQGEKLSYNEDYMNNCTFLRFDNCIMLDENMEVCHID